MLRQFYWCALLLTGAVNSASLTAQTVFVDLETNQGTIQLELDSERAPKTVANFVQYAKDGHYNGTIFHRVIANFMIQGGGLTESLEEKPTRDPIPNESKNGLSNKQYTIAMARTAEPHTATCQFFINVQDNPELDAGSSRGEWGYAVFGKVVGGQDVVETIRQLPTRPRGIAHENVPVQAVVIQKVTIREK